MDKLERKIMDLKMQAEAAELQGIDASERWFLYSCLRSLKEILDSGDCNDCKKRLTCAFRPLAGQMTRFNCFLLERRNDNNDKM